MSDTRVVSEELFGRQLDVVKDLSRAVMDNATATKGVAETAQVQTRLLERIDERNEEGRTWAVDDVKAHIEAQTSLITTHMNNVIGKLEFWNKPQWWVSVAIIAGALFLGSPVAERLFLRLGLMR